MSQSPGCGGPQVSLRAGASVGAGRVIVNLPSNQVGVDIRQQGQTLVVEFLRSTLPDTLRRRLDVTDFGTPVRTVSAFQNGDRVRMVVEPTGAWEHSAYQTDTQFVLEVRPMKIIGETEKLDAKKVKRVVVCSGKLYYELLAERRSKEIEPRQLRDQARSQLRERKFEEAYKEWVKDLRARSFIEMRDSGA